MMADQSSRDMSWAVRLANRKFTVDQIAQALAGGSATGKRPAGSMKYQRILVSKGREDAAKYAVRTAERAVAWVRDNPKVTDKGGAAVRLVSIEAAAEALPWLVYCGPEARRALEAALVVAWRVGSLNFGLSLREWAEIAGLDFESIRTARNILVDEGWLRRNPADRNGRTARFTVRTPSHIHSHQGDMNVGLHDDRAWLAHDAFREHALGSVGWAVLRGIPAVPTRRDVFKKRVALDEEEVWPHLLRLERAQLIALGDESIRRVGDDPIPLLDAFALQAGTAGDLTALRSKHAAERKAWRKRGDVNVGAEHGS
jgi:hypothetical protein